MLADPCADPRIFARVVEARLPENSSNNVFVFFCPQLLQFYSGLSMVYFKEIYNLLGFGGGGEGGGGGSDLFQGVKLFPWGRGVQMLILETNRTCDFPGAVRTLYPPLWIRACDHLTTRN